MKARKFLHKAADRLHDDSGNAVVEFVGLAVIVLIPLVYLVLMLSAVQSASFAADTTARQAARIAATEPNAHTRANRISGLTEGLTQDYGVKLEPANVAVSCNRDSCTDPGALVRVDVSVPVELPGVGVFGMDTGVANVSATHVQRADEHVEKAR